MEPSRDRAAREHAYSPSRWARNFEATLIRQAKLGERLRERHSPERLAYGPGAMEQISLFVPESETPRPLMVFLHGGYWQELDATATDFMAAAWLQKGWAFASLDYPLAPGASIEDMVEACRRGVAMLRDTASEHRLDGRIHLGGHSAGAQLALMSCLGEGRPRCIDSLWLISGIYDLRPLVGTYINEPLGLNDERAERLSPLCRDLKGLPPLKLVHGELDPPVFRAQGKQLEEVARAKGVTSELVEIKGCDHFDVLERLGGKAVMPFS